MQKDSKYFGKKLLKNVKKTILLHLILLPKIIPKNLRKISNLILLHLILLPKIVPKNLRMILNLLMLLNLIHLLPKIIPKNLKKISNLLTFAMIFFINLKISLILIHFIDLLKKKLFQMK
jgi:hypothetical protein